MKYNRVVRYDVEFTNEELIVLEYALLRYIEEWDNTQAEDIPEHVLKLHDNLSSITLALVEGGDD